METKRVQIRAFSYSRVSGDNQAQEDKGGIPRQQQICRSVPGYTIVQEFVDEGVSGTIESLNRPGWKAMLAALLANGVKTVIIEHPDRLARKLMVQENAVQTMEQYGFTLIRADTGQTMTNLDDSQVMHRQIEGALAQNVRATIVKRLRAGRERKRAETGHCEGKKPYGAREGEAEVIQRVMAMRANGESLAAIAVTLNAEGVPTRTEKRPTIWYGSTVNNILRRAKKGGA